MAIARSTSVCDACRPFAGLFLSVALAGSLVGAPFHADGQAARRSRANGEPTTEYLIRSLREDTDPRIRRWAAWSLAGEPTRSKLDALGAALEDEDDLVRAYAAGSLATFGEPAIDTLLAALDSTYGRPRAIDALIAIGDPAVGRLLGLVDAPEIEIRRSVIHVLAEIGPDPDVALSPVIEVFRQRGADVEGVWLVPLFASLGVAAVPPLVQFVGQDHDPRLRENACRALGAIGPPAASAVPALLRALEGAIPRVRFSAAFALGEIGDPSVVPALIERLHHDENRTVRMYAASALGNIDARFEETVPALLRTLEVDDDIVAAHAVAALELVGDRAIPWLRDALSAESERLRGYAARVAGALGPAADPLIPLLVDRLGVDPSDDVARRAATALRELESQAHERLVEAARSPDPRVRGYAVLILGEARSTAADSVRLLTAALEDPDLQVCRLAAWSLGSIGPQDPDVVSALIARLGSEDVELRRTAAWALGNIGPAAAAAEEPLTTRLEDGDPTVRVEAAEALDKIHGTYRYGS